MGRRFLANSRYGQLSPENPEQLRTVAGQLINGAGKLLVSERDGKLTGMIGFLVFPHPLSGQLVAGELFWWVEPEYRGDGLRLLKEAERAARELGAVRMQMVAPDERVERLYERLGYQYVESAYERELKGN